MPEYLTPSAYVEETPRRAIVAAPSAITAFVGHTLAGPINRIVPVGSFLEYSNAFGGLAASSELSYAVLQFFRNGGQRALILRVPELDTGLPDLEALIGATSSVGMGLRGLEANDEFELLCVPDATRPRAPNGTVSEFRSNKVNELWQAALDLCRRKRALLLIDAPVEIRSTMAAQAWVGELPREHGEFAAAYGPWIEIADPLHDGALRRCAPTGTIAGLIARTDAQRSLWQAPAGIEATLRQVKGLTAGFGDADQAILNPLSLNMLRLFDDRGPVCWGARTLDLSGDWTYVATRRLASHVERSLARGLAWTATEENAVPLWHAVRQDVAAFLQTLFRAGAFAGQTPDDSYFVKCGADTTTQNDIDEGRLILEIGIAPLRPAEFVILRIGLTTQPPSG